MVVAIIALLLGILLPSLAAAREAGRRATCQSRARQIATAMAAYTVEYRGSFPIAYYTEGIGPNMVNHNWDTITEHGEARPGIIWSFTSSYEVQQCPSFKGNSNTSADEYTGYNYNTTYIGRGQHEGTWGGMTRAPARMSQLGQPADTALIGDGGYGAGANKFMRAPYDGSPLGAMGIHAGGQAYRHADTTNVAWADSHVTTTRTRAKRSDASAAMLGFQGWPDNGFLGEDNRLYDRQ